MTSINPPPTTATTRVAIRLAVYYAVLIVGGIIVWRVLPRGSAVAPASLDALFGGGPSGAGKGSSPQALKPPNEKTLHSLREAPVAR